MRQRPGVISSRSVWAIWLVTVSKREKNVTVTVKPMRGACVACEGCRRNPQERKEKRSEGTHCLLPPVGTEWKDALSNAELPHVRTK